MPYRDDDLFTRRMLRTVFAVFGVSALILLAWVARHALTLIYISGLIATSLSPLVRRIERSHLTRRHGGIPRSVAIFVIYALFVIVVALIGLAVIPPLIEQATALWAQLPDVFNRVQDSLIRAGLVLHPITLREAVQQSPTADPASAVNAVLAAGSTVIGGAVGVVTVLILSFYLLIEAGSMFEYLMHFVPKARRPATAHAAAQVVVKVSAWLQANFILGGVMGTTSAVVLGLIGEPFFYVVALVAALGEVIPMVGPIIAGVVAVGLAFTRSPKFALGVGIFFVALHEIEANILVPKIMERRVGVNAVVIMLALLIGWELAGLTGAVLAIPTAAIASVIVTELSPPDKRDA